MSGKSNVPGFHPSLYIMVEFVSPLKYHSPDNPFWHSLNFPLSLNAVEIRWSCYAAAVGRLLLMDLWIGSTRRQLVSSPFQAAITEPSSISLICTLQSSPAIPVDLQRGSTLGVGDWSIRDQSRIWAPSMGWWTCYTGLATGWYWGSLRSTWVSCSRRWEGRC